MVATEYRPVQASPLPPASAPEPRARRPRLAVHGGAVRYGLRDVNTLARGEGPIHAFEASFVRLSGARHALAMNSGTAALHSAYFAVGEPDELRDLFAAAGLGVDRFDTWQSATRLGSADAGCA